MASTTLNPAQRRVVQSSALSRHSAAVFAAAEEAPVEVTRRDGETLVLTTKREAAARERILEVAAQLPASRLAPTPSGSSVHPNSVTGRYQR